MKKLALLLCLVPVVATAGPKNKKKAKKSKAAPAATADADRDAALAAWQTMVERGNAGDPTSLDLMTSDGVLETVRTEASGETRTLELPFAKLRPIWPQTMMIARMRGDIDEFRDVRIEEDGEGWRIRAVRYSQLKCTDDPNYTATVVREDDAWKVGRISTATVAETQCAPSIETARGIAARIVTEIAPLTPLTLDADTRLDSIEADGAALTYRQTLVTTPASEVEQIGDVFLPILTKQVCTNPPTKLLVHHGGTTQFVYVTNDGEKTLEFEVASCAD